jgi:hypothetical protein
MELEEAYNEVKRIVCDADKESARKIYTKERQNRMYRKGVTTEIIFVTFELPVDDNLKPQLVSEVEQILPEWTLHDEQGTFVKDEGEGLISVSRDVPDEDLDRLYELDMSDTFDE